MFHKQATFYK